MRKAVTGMNMKISRGAGLLAMGVAILGAIEIWRVGWSWDEVLKQSLPWLIIATAAMIHELGHVVAAVCLGVGIRGMKLDLFGARLELGGMLSYGGECWIAVGGPLANFLSVALLCPIPLFQETGGGALFLGASLTLGCVNLLPLWTLDGGRILRSAVAWVAGDRVADRLLQWTTGMCLGLLWLLAVYALLRKGQMLSLFAFSLCLLLRTVKREP
jgi:stage IV sporulation protein FB